MLTEMVTVPLLLPVILLVSTGGMPFIDSGFELANIPPVRPGVGFFGVIGRVVLPVVAVEEAVLATGLLASADLSCPLDWAKSGLAV